MICWIFYNIKLENFGEKNNFLPGDSSSFSFHPWPPLDPMCGFQTWPCALKWPMKLELTISEQKLLICLHGLVLFLVLFLSTEKQALCKLNKACGTELNFSCSREASLTEFRRTYISAKIRTKTEACGQPLSFRVV